MIDLPIFRRLYVLFLIESVSCTIYRFMGVFIDNIDFLEMSFSNGRSNYEFGERLFLNLGSSSQSVTKL